MFKKASPFSFYVFSHLGLFAFVTIVHSLLYILSPFSHQSGSHTAFIFSWIYVSFVTLVTVLLWGFFRRHFRDTQPKCFILLKTQPTWVLAIPVGLAAIGLGCHLWDKIGLRGYTYSWCGLGSIRELWLRNMGRLGPSSIYSALGHLLTYSTIPLLMMSLAPAPSKNRALRLSLLVGAILCLFIYASSLGTRSVILFFWTVLVCSVIVQFVSANGEAKLSRSLDYIGLIGALFFAYSILLWVGRIQCTEEDKRTQYVSDNADNLNLVAFSKRTVRVGKLTTLETLDGYIDDLKARFAMELVEPKGFRKTLYDCMLMIFVYTDSGITNFQESLFVGNARVGTIAFDFLGAWLSKLRIIAQPPSSIRSFGRGLISLPGVIWYDWGLRGYWVMGILHALSIIFLYFLICQAGFLSQIGYWLSLQLLLIEIHSPLDFAPALMAYPFVSGMVFVAVCLLLLIENSKLPFFSRRLANAI